MVFKTLVGSSKRVSKPKKYLIKWASPSRSKMQYSCKQFLKDYWAQDIVFEEFPIAGTRLSIDFYNSNKKIEERYFFEKKVDGSKGESKLNWMPDIDLEYGIEKTVEWYMVNYGK